VDTPEKIRAGFSRKLFSIRAPEKFRLITALKTFPETLSAYPFGDSVHVTFLNDTPVDSLADRLKKEGVNGAVIVETTPGIEDRFLELMEKPGEG